jgi:hypothetical protein
MLDASQQLDLAVTALSNESDTPDQAVVDTEPEAVTKDLQPNISMEGESAQEVPDTPEEADIKSQDSTDPHVHKEHGETPIDSVPVTLDEDPAILMGSENDTSGESCMKQGKDEHGDTSPLIEDVTNDQPEKSEILSASTNGIELDGEEQAETQIEAVEAVKPIESDNGEHDSANDHTTSEADADARQDEGDTAIAELTQDQSDMSESSIHAGEQNAEEHDAATAVQENKQASDANIDDGAAASEQRPELMTPDIVAAPGQEPSGMFNFFSL